MIFKKKNNIYIKNSKNEKGNKKKKKKRKKRNLFKVYC
jgi:hypothetical protein